MLKHILIYDIMQELGATVHNLDKAESVLMNDFPFLFWDF
jgi:hypothetical protein